MLTLSAGLLFGCVIGTAAAVVGATAGATIVFLIARNAFSDTLAHRAEPLLGKLRDGFQQNALSYLLFLRLVPGFPFWLVNLASALLGVRLRTYMLGTFIGIIPGTLAIASVGAGIDAVVLAAEADHAACVAATGAAQCTLAITPGALVNTQLVAALALLRRCADPRGIAQVETQSTRVTGRPAPASQRDKARRAVWETRMRSPLVRRNRIRVSERDREASNLCCSCPEERSKELRVRSRS